MAIVFPSSPQVNDTHTVDGATWVWTGEYWRRVTGSITTVTPTLTVGGTLEVNGATVFDGAITTNASASIGGHVIPDTNITYDLGSDTYRFRDIYLSGSSINLGDVVLSATATGLSVEAGGNPALDFATESYVDTAISNLIGGAPEALNTLNELAVALDNDESYASTITTALAGKLDSSSYTAADVLAKLLTVDGAGSSLDADTLDGEDGAYYQPASTALTTATSFGGDVSGAYDNIVVANDSHTHDTRYFTETEADARFLGISAKAADSNLFDGLDSGVFTRHMGSITSQDWNTFATGNMSSFYGVSNMSGSNRPPAYTYGLAVNYSSNGQGKLQIYAPHNGSDGGNGLWFRSGWNTEYDAWSEIWHSRNDGSGSGLDADLLDGYHVSGIVDYGSNSNGFYLRTWDGWQICSHKSGSFAVNAGTTSAGSGVTVYYDFSYWTYPAAFAAAPVVVASTEDLGSGAHWAEPEGIGTSSVRIYVLGNNTNVAWQAVAIGRYL